MRTLAFCAYTFEIKDETIALKDMHGINHIPEPEALNKFFFFSYLFFPVTSHDNKNQYQCLNRGSSEYHTGPNAL